MPFTSLQGYNEIGYILPQFIFNFLSNILFTSSQAYNEVGYILPQFIFNFLSNIPFTSLQEYNEATSYLDMISTFYRISRLQA